MTLARKLVALGRAARTDAKVRVRQPLKRALLVLPGVELDDELRREIREELNVKELQDVADLSGLMSWTVVPNFRTLGPRLGPRVNELKRALSEVDGNAVQSALEERGWVEVAGERLATDDLELRASQHQDFALAREGALAVALDLELDDDLRVEGTARELVRDINELRRTVGLNLTDRVTLSVDASDAPQVRAAVEAHRQWIAGEILAEELRVGALDDGHRLDVDGEQVAVSLQKTG